MAKILKFKNIGTKSVRHTGKKCVWEMWDKAGQFRGEIRQIGKRWEITNAGWWTVASLKEILQFMESKQGNGRMK